MEVSFSSTPAVHITSLAASVLGTMLHSRESSVSVFFIVIFGFCVGDVRSLYPEGAVRLQYLEYCIPNRPGESLILKTLGMLRSIPESSRMCRAQAVFFILAKKNEILP